MHLIRNKGGAPLALLLIGLFGLTFAGAALSTSRVQNMIAGVGAATSGTSAEEITKVSLLEALQRKNGSQLIASSQLTPLEITKGDAFLQGIVPERYIVELSADPLIKTKRRRAALFGSTATHAQKKADLQAQQVSFFDSLPDSVKAKNGGATLHSGSGGVTTFTVTLNGVVLSMNAEEAMQVRELRGVIDIEPVRVVRANLMDSVPLIRAPEVWSGAVASTSYTGRGVSIAVIDTGIDYTHPDLGGCFESRTIGTSSIPCKVIGGYDFVNKDGDPMDDHGHGTHVAATAAGKGVLKGVAPDAVLYAYKVLSASGSGTSENVIAAIERAADPNQDGDYADHLDVINLSLGGSGNPDDVMSKAVDNTVAAGVVVAVAAGNAGAPESIGSPGTARKAITVGATTKYDGLAWFSSRGPVVWRDQNGAVKYLVKPDVSAPGLNICAAQWADAFSDADVNCNKDSEHVGISGTSMATPHVAGAAALLLERHPDWMPAEVKTALRQSAVRLAGDRMYRNVEVGFGRIDVLKTLQSARLPIAEIGALGVVKRSIDIMGTASFSSGGSYHLSYGEGEQPTAYTILPAKKNPVTDGVLLKSFTTSALNEGTHSLELIVNDAEGNQSRDVGLFEVNNMEITSVGSQFNYVNHGPQSVKGRIELPGVTYFRISLGKPGGPMLCDGTPPHGEELCTIQADTLPEGVQKLYLEVMQDNLWKADLPFEIGVIRELMDGWPQELQGFDRGLHSVIASASSTKELLVPHFQSCEALGGGWSECRGTSLVFYDEKGTARRLEKLSNKKNIPDDWVSASFFNPVRGRTILSLGGYNRTALVDREGTVVAEWAVSPGTLRPSFPTIFDRDRSGVPEIYTSALLAKEFSEEGMTLEGIRVEGHSAQGVMLPGFPLMIPHDSAKSQAFMSSHLSFLGEGGDSASSTEQFNLALVAGDFNVGTVEEYWSAKDVSLFAHVFSPDNKLIKSSVIYESQGVYEDVWVPLPVSADFDGDGKDELAIAYGVVDIDRFFKNRYDLDAYRTYIKILESDGSLQASYGPIKGYMPRSLAAGRLGKTREASLIAVLSDTWPTTELGHKIIALDGSLETLFLLDEKTLASADHLVTGVTTGDVDGDGEAEILLSYRPRWWWGGAPSGIQILSGNGTMERNLDLSGLGGTNVFFSPVLNDFDGDGAIDVTLQSYFTRGQNELPLTRLFPITLGGAYREGAAVQWASILRDNELTGCLDCVPRTPATPEPPRFLELEGPAQAGQRDVIYTWILTATDPDGTFFSYDINWGDGMHSQGTKSYTTVGTPQEIAIKRNVPVAGQYPVAIRITDIDGWETIATTTLDARDGPVSILSPAWKQVVEKGKPTRVRWMAEKENTVFNISAVHGQTKRVTPIISLSSSKGENIYLWDVPTNIASGTYTLRFQMADASTTPFTGISKNTYEGNEFVIKDVFRAFIYGTPALKLYYNNAREEERLEAEFTLDVQGGGEEVVIERWLYAYLTDQNGANWTPPDSGRLLGVTGDIVVSEGDGSFIVPPYKKGTIKVAFTYNVRSMFAGTYQAHLAPLYLRPGQKYNTGEVPSNPVTIIGEVSPYITELQPRDFETDTSVEIVGIRFSEQDNILRFWGDGKGGEEKEIRKKSTANGTRITFIPQEASLSNGWYGLQVINEKLGRVAGASNVFWFRIGKAIEAKPLAVSVRKKPASLEEVTLEERRKLFTPVLPTKESPLNNVVSSSSPTNPLRARTRISSTTPTASPSSTPTPTATPVSISVSASPSVIKLGASVTITWSVSGAPRSCSNSWSGSGGAQGSYQGAHTVSPSATTAYLITCFDQNGGSITKEITVTVEAPSTPARSRSASPSTSSSPSPTPSSSPGASVPRERTSLLASIFEAIETLADSFSALLR